MKNDIGETIEISVRSLVEFLLTTGDIDERVGALNENEAMQAGSRVHRKIQKMGGPSYHAEVPLSRSVSFDGYDLVIRGRADGIIFEEEAPGEEDLLVDLKHPVVVDEIKGMYRDVSAMDAPLPVHVAQARCYAAIFAEDHGLPAIGVRMTYVDLDDEENIRIFEEQFQTGELVAWFSDLVSSYRRWSDFLYFWKQIRNASIDALAFPYPYRKGQKKLISDVYYSLDQGRPLFLQAPTGSGKTLCTIFPALKFMGQGKARNIFYLTAKNMTRTVAEDAFAILKEGGLALKTVTLSSKEKTCVLEAPSCNPEGCSYAKGYFDRLQDALYDCLTGTDTFTSASLEEFCRARNVCPYYFARALSDWCDAIICDYNYVFDPTAALSRFFAEGRRGDYVFLIDEAHNLVERGRDMYSQTLFKEDFLAARKFFPRDICGVKRCLTRVNNLLNAWKKETEGLLFPDRDLPGERDRLAFALLNLANAIEKYFDSGIEDERNEALRELYFAVRFFLMLAEEAGEDYVFYCELTEGGRYAVNLFCADPSQKLQARLETGRAAVFFSATLLPMDYYRTLLCRENRPYRAYATSSFDPARLGLFIGGDVTSLYRERSEDMYGRYAKAIREIVAVRPGNYMVFFPSYAFMNNVYSFLEAEGGISGCDVLLQDPDMKEEDRRAFLARFEAMDGETVDEERANEEASDGIRAGGGVQARPVTAFCVMGGAFSEGIDLTGDRLVGAIIAGAALPKFSSRQEILKDYFSNRGMDGFSYAYLYPGMNKVLQAAGRVIRTENDTGIVVLLDRRFERAAYRACFPPEWENVREADSRALPAAIADFWEKQTNSP